jgi:hypothetical protein
VTSLAELGARIDRKKLELEREGVLEPGIRRRAADLKIEHARLEALDKAIREGSAHPERAATLAGEIEALKVSVDELLAGY